MTSGSAEQQDPSSALGSSNAALLAGRILLLDAPLELERALNTALSPWGLRVESVVHARLGPTLPGNALRASTLARELDAYALVWLSNNTDGTALWLYERANDTVVARPVPNRPLDEALAAGLALSIKTWLRISEPRPTTEAPPSTLAITPAPTRLAVAPAFDSAPALDTPVQADPEAARARIIIYAAARVGALEPGVTEPRYGLEVRASALQSQARGTQLWLGVRLHGGTPTTMSTDTFRGTYSEFGAGVSVGISQRLVGGLGLGLYAGTTLSQSSLSGTFLDGAAAERTRLGMAAQIGPELELSLGPVGILLQPSLGASARRHRYAADGVEVLETGGLWWMLGGGLCMNVF